MATPSQAEIVLRAMSYSTGELWESIKTPVMSCAWIFAYPWLTGKVNHLVTGMAFGSKAKQVFPEGWILISIPWDKIPVIVKSLEKMTWALPCVHRRPREVHGTRGARAGRGSARGGGGGLVLRTADDVRNGGDLLPSRHDDVDLGPLFSPRTRRRQLADDVSLVGPGR